MRRTRQPPAPAFPQKQPTIHPNASMRISIRPQKDPETRRAAASRVERGESMKSVARDLGVCPETVRNWCRAAGVEPPESGAAIRAYAVRRVERGESLSSVASDIGMSYDAVRCWCLSAGMALRPGRPKKAAAAAPDRSGPEYGPRDRSGTRQARILARLRAALPEICRAARERHRDDFL